MLAQSQFAMLRGCHARRFQSHGCFGRELVVPLHLAQEPLMSVTAALRAARGRSTIRCGERH
jgi:hypothetical protein